jgi:hypothetical protein
MPPNRGAGAEDGVVAGDMVVVVSVPIKELEVDLLQMEELLSESQVSHLSQVKVMGGWVNRSHGTMPLIL